MKLKKRGLSSILPNLFPNLYFEKNIHQINLNHNSILELKQKYLFLSQLYSRLNNQKQQQYCSTITHLKEKIEFQLQIERRVKNLFHKTTFLKTSQQQKSNYFKLTYLIKQLNTQTQQQYLTELINLKEKLELIN